MLSYDEQLDYFGGDDAGAAYETFAATDDGAAVVEAEEEGQDWIPACAEVRRIMDAAATCGEMCDALKAHRAAQCAVCMAERKDVVSERLALRTPDAVCCEVA